MNSNINWDINELGSVEYELTFENGPIIKYTFSNEPYKINCEEFTYINSEGKLWALDRTKDSGRFFTIYPSRNFTKGSKDGILNVHIQAQGPCVCFMLSLF